jgi:hypothetical protein
VVQRGAEQKDGVLKGHFKLGRVYKTPMNSLNVSPTDWTTDDFPDLIWSAVLAAVYDDNVIDNFKSIQGAVFRKFGTEVIEAEGITIDGRLTSLERVPVERRPAVVGLLRAAGLLEIAVPDELLAALRHYRGVPGAWLLVEPFADRTTPALDADDAVTYLARAFVKAIGDSHRKALIVFPPMQWLCYRKKISVTPDMAKAFDTFPHNGEDQGAADASVRSSAMLMDRGPFTDAAVTEATQAWAKSFWHQNWHMTKCQPAELKDDLDSVVNAETGEAAATEYERLLPAPGESEDLADQVEALFNRFITAALDNDREVDLYDPTRHEVICGLMSRATRATLILVSNPDLWGGEHGAGVLRLFAETEINMIWMAKHGDDAIYHRYQEYGQGKAKLAHANMNAMIEAMGADAPDVLKQSTEKLGKQLGGEWATELIDVDLGSTFSGKNIRDMASEADLADTYKHIYQQASSVTHGEWWTIEDSAMQRCLNPLHKFHLIPSFNAQPAFGAEMGKMLVGKLERLLGQAVRFLFPAGEPPVPLKDA